MNKRYFLVGCVLASLLAVASEEQSATHKPAPDQILADLLAGNQRFIQDLPRHPHCDAGRRQQAATENQSTYAVATVLSCSDSRVPVELIFDAGIMDLFVIRVPGNIFQTDQIAGAEYGVYHVNTPLVLVLGHSDCGAVNAAVALETNQMQHKLERNIPRLLTPVCAMVRRALAEHPEMSKEELVDYCVRENVYAEISNLFLGSASVREAAAAGKIKVAGAIYDLKSGQVKLLDGERVAQLLKEAQASDRRETQALAD